MRLSLFRNIDGITTKQPTIVKLMEGRGVQLVVPVELWSGRRMVEDGLVANIILSPTQVINAYKKLPESAVHRPEYCRNGHRQTSLNVIHWPNGNEDCRVCHLEREATKKATAK